MGPLAFLHPLLLALTLLSTLEATPQPPPTIPEPAVVTSCWLQPRFYWSFTSGTVDYCRGHLRYVPGTLDCFRTGEQVCSIWLPDRLSWTESHEPLFPPEVLPCPDAPEPPVCPRMR